MKLEKSKKHDVNYLAKVVDIQSFIQHPDPEVTKLKVAKIDGFSVVLGISSDPGLYIYFPTNCQINPQFLSYCNLYRDAELNTDTTQKGYIEKNGRCQAIKLRGQLSEGILIPAEQLQSFCIANVNKEISLSAGTEFDIISDDSKSFWLTKKYIPKYQGFRSNSESKKKGRKYKVPKRLNKIIDTQFRFHYQTVLIKKCPHVVYPDSWINITKKIDGTSGVSAYVLCRRDLTWREKLGRWISGDKSEPVQYDYVYSSRTVIKNPYYNPESSKNKGYYGEVDGDVWMYADKYLRPFLQKGMTFYYEIVGYLPSGKFIQKSNDFGCIPPKAGEDYTVGKHCKIKIYRITLTNPAGIVHEFAPFEVQTWCKENGLEPVHLFYEGYAKDLYPDLAIDDKWNENWMNRLSNDKNFYMELPEPECINKIPMEGLVIKVNNMKSEAFKLKTFAHLNNKQKLLDKGEADVESIS